MPIGDRYTMGAKTAALACQRFFQFETIVPCHYGTFPVLDQTADRFVAEMGRHNVLVPEVGVPSRPDRRSCRLQGAVLDERSSNQRTLRPHVRRSRHRPPHRPPRPARHHRRVRRQRLEKELSGILDWVAQLDEIDTSACRADDAGRVP